MISGYGVDRDQAMGVVLYAVTAALEALVAGGARFVLGYGVAVVLGVLGVVSVDAMALGVWAAVLPVLYSVVGVGYPLRGRLWRWRIGAREPVGQEAERIEDAVAVLSGSGGESLPEFECYVIDEVWPMAMTRGRAVVVSRGLVELDDLAAKLGHELGHVASLDGRLTEGLHRLQLWSDPLREGTGAAESPGMESALRGPGGFVFGILRWLVRLAGGGDVRRVFGATWAWYWRRREFAADAFAARLGQAQALRGYLEDVELAVDAPQRGSSRGQFDHPYVAERIDRLRALGEVA